MIEEYGNYPMNDNGTKANSWHSSRLVELSLERLYLEMILRCFVNSWCELFTYRIRDDYKTTKFEKNLVYAQTKKNSVLSLWLIMHGTHWIFSEIAGKNHVKSSKVVSWYFSTILTIVQSQIAHKVDSKPSNSNQHEYLHSYFLKEYIL